MLLHQQPKRPTRQDLLSFSTVHLWNITMNALSPTITGPIAFIALMLTRKALYIDICELGISAILDTRCLCAFIHMAVVIVGRN